MKIVLMEANFDRTYIDTNHQVVAGTSASTFRNLNCLLRLHNPDDKSFLIKDADKD